MLHQLHPPEVTITLIVVLEWLFSINCLITIRKNLYTLPIYIIKG